jgi:hypothetical protein
MRVAGSSGRFRISRRVAGGLEAVSSPGDPLLDIPSGAKLATEIGVFRSGESENHTSVAEAIADLIAFIPGINPRPTF